MYTAAVLTNSSQSVLKWLLKSTINFQNQGYNTETPRGDPLPHHMTINLGKIDESLNPKDILGKTYKIEIDSIYQDDSIGACAAHVSKSEIKTIHDDTDSRHITLCLKKQVKPVASNNLFNSPLGTVIVHKIKPFTVECIVQELP